MTAADTPKRVRAGHVAWVSDRLSQRDWQIVQIVNELHLVTGWQLDRLFFAGLAGRSRIVTRSRVLARLVSWQVLTRLPRRIGGAMRGSSVAVYCLGSAGQRLLTERAGDAAPTPRIRKARVPGDRFVQHILAVSALYVELAEYQPGGNVGLRQFVAEPACWWPNGRGGWLKPDALVVVTNGQVDHLWWVEVDRATESLPTLGRKLRTYLDFVNRGGLGPRDGVPRVLVTVPHVARREAIHQLTGLLPAPATELFYVVLHEHAATWLTEMVQR